MKYRLAYICSPLSASSAEGIESNRAAAEAYMDQVSAELSCRAVAPHAHLPLLLDDHDPRQRALGLRFGMELLEFCDVLVICSNIVSIGMAGEIRRAAELNIPILVRHAAGTYHPPSKLPSPGESLEKEGWTL